MRRGAVGFEIKKSLGVFVHGKGHAARKSSPATTTAAATTTTTTVNQESLLRE
jgi:hypothetical protein